MSTGVSRGFHSASARPSLVPHLTIPFVPILESRGPHGESRSASNSPVPNRSVSRCSSSRTSASVRYQHALRDDQRRTIRRDLVQPTGVGHRRPDHRVAGVLGVEPSSQRDDVRHVDVEPAHARRHVEPERTTIKSTTQVQYDGVRVAPQKAVGPLIELLRPQRNQELVAPWLDDSVDTGEVVVDPVDCFGGRPVAQNRALQPTFVGARIQGAQIGPFTEPQRTPEKSSLLVWSAIVFPRNRRSVCP